MFVWVDQTQMCLWSISLLELFHGIIHNIEGLKGGDLGALNYWGDLIWKGVFQTPLHTMNKLYVKNREKYAL